MAPKVHRPVLTTSQAACLSALKDGKDSNTSIAIQAGLDLRKVIASLRKLEELGLARRGEMNTWSVTVRGKKCHSRTVPETTRQGNKPLGPGLRRLLDALDRPMRGGELAKKMGVSKQNVHHHIVKLYSLGQIRLGDPERPLLIVSRINDETPLLSYREERLLSAIPTDSATSAIKIKIATRLPEKRIQQLLSHLRAYGLIDARDGLEGEIVFGLTARGLSHPQRSVRGRRANLPSLPLRSDRVVAVLAAILDAGALRIRDIGDSLRIPQDSIRALIQYLKRKKMVQKTDQTFYAPYSLTEKGIETLSEMTRRLAA